MCRKKLNMMRIYRGIISVFLFLFLCSCYRSEITIVDIEDDYRTIDVKFPFYQKSRGLFLASGMYAKTGWGITYTDKNNLRIFKFDFHSGDILSDYNNIPIEGIWWPWSASRCFFPESNEFISFKGSDGISAYNIATKKMHTWQSNFMEGYNLFSIYPIRENNVFLSFLNIKQKKTKLMKANVQSERIFGEKNYNDSIKVVSISNSGKYAIIHFLGAKKVSLFDIESMKELNTLMFIDDFELNGAFSIDDKFVIIGNYSKYFLMNSSSECSSIELLEAPDGYFLYDIKFISNKEVVYAQSKSFNSNVDHKECKTLVFYDILAKKEIKRLPFDAIVNINVCGRYVLFNK